MSKIVFNRHFFDWKLMLPLIALLIIGYIMIFSTTSFKGLAEYNDAYFFIKRHSSYVLLGIFLFFLGGVVPIKLYKDVAVFGYVVAIVLLLITLVPGIGVKIGGAQRWLNIGGFQFQPVEFMKFWWAVAVSLVLANKKQLMGSFSKGVLPVLMVMCAPILCLMLQPDLGNSILILFVVFSLLFLSTLPVWVLLGTGLMGGVVILVSVLTHPYQKARIMSFFNPWLDPLGANYHIIQSFTAIGSGGVFGFGIGESRLKYFYLPLHYSDFIFSILCEEGGLILACIVICAFLALCFRGLQISRLYKAYSFEQYLACSLTLFLIYQAIINMCVVTGLFPITGIPLTFISYGGTSLLSSMFSLGVIYRLGRSV